MSDAHSEFRDYVARVPWEESAQRCVTMGEAALARAKSESEGTAHRILFEYIQRAALWYNRHGGIDPKSSALIQKLDQVFEDADKERRRLEARGAGQQSVAWAVVTGFWDGLGEGAKNVAGTFAAPFDPAKQGTFWRWAFVGGIALGAVWLFLRR